MSEGDPEDQSLRAKMRDLRARDERTAPPFDPMWRAAEESARKRRAAPRWLAPSATLGGLAAAAAVVVLAVRAPEPAAPSAASAPAATVATTGTPHGAARVADPFAARPELALDFLLASPGPSDLAALTSFDADPLSRRAGGL